MPVLAQSSTLGAMRAEVDGRIKNSLLANPDPVFNYGIDRAAHRAVGADGAFNFDFSGAVTSTRCCGARFFDQCQLSRRQTDTDAQTRAAQKRTSVHRRKRIGQTPRQAVDEPGRTSALRQFTMKAI